MNDEDEPGVLSAIFCTADGSWPYDAYFLPDSPWLLLIVRDVDRRVSVHYLPRYDQIIHHADADGECRCQPTDTPVDIGGDLHFVYQHWPCVLDYYHDPVTFITWGEAS